MSTSKDKRKHIRVSLISESVTLFIGDKGKTVQMENISPDGIFVRLDDISEVKPKDLVLILLSLPGNLGDLSINGQIVRVVWAPKKGESKGIGLQFTNITTKVQKIIDAYVVYLRNKQIITVRKRIIDEFNREGSDPL